MENRDHLLKPFIVLHRDEFLLPYEPPFAWKCMAEDGDHAEEQFTNAFDEMEIVWVVETDDADAAYQNYWGNDDSLD